MPKAHGHGEGTIRSRKNKDGKITRWTAELMVGYDDQGRKKVWRASGKTRKEVADKLAQAIVDHGKGTLVVQSRQTVAEFLRRWLEDVAKTNTYARTYLGYKRYVELHAIPTLGEKRLDRLTAQDLQRLYAEKRATLSAQSIVHLHRCLHRAFEFAVRWNLLVRNPCDLADPPKLPKREVESLTPEQARSFLAALRGDPMEAYWTLALTTAMRPGELLGTKWSDLDLAADPPVLRLQRAVGRIPGQGFDEKDVKTHQSRAIVLTPIAVEVLKRHRAAQLQARLMAGARWEDRDLVFCNGVGRPLEQGNLLRRSFVPILERAGLPRIRPYDLRHSTASILAYLGVPPHVIAEILGHVSPTLTMRRYAHALPTMHAEAMMKLDQLLAPRATAEENGGR